MPLLISTAARYVYRISQEEKSIFREVIISVILSTKNYWGTLVPRIKVENVKKLGFGELTT
jgi:hypothetical protein